MTRPIITTLLFLLLACAGVLVLLVACALVATVVEFLVDWLPAVRTAAAAHVGNKGLFAVGGVALLMLVAGEYKKERQ